MAILLAISYSCMRAYVLDTDVLVGPSVAMLAHRASARGGAGSPIRLLLSVPLMRSTNQF